MIVDNLICDWTVVRGRLEETAEKISTVFSLTGGRNESHRMDRRIACGSGRRSMTVSRGRTAHDIDGTVTASNGNGDDEDGGEQRG